MANELTLADLGPLEQWSEDMLKLYREGRDDIEVATEMNISMRAFRKLYSISEVFAEFVDFGRQCSQAYWHSLARRGARKENNIDNGILRYNLSNRYNWVERTEQKQEIKQLDQTPEEIKRRIAEKLQAMSKEPIDVDFTEVSTDKLLALSRQVITGKDANESSERLPEED